MFRTLALLVALTVIASLAPAHARGGGGHGSSSGSYNTTGSNPSSHYTQGYTMRNGSTVAPHYQTDPNATMRDNYSTKGNINPHTGAVGTRAVPY